MIGAPGPDRGPQITERAGDLAARHQFTRLCARYRWAADACEGREVLEVACGTGIGLGLLAGSARAVVAGDLSPANLGVARATYGPRVPLVRFDAQALPFASRTLTAVVCLEGLYFLPSVDAFLAEARRVLHADGTLLVSVVNRDCPGFDPSNPAYARTYGAPELAADLERHGFEVTMFATTVMDARGARARWLRAAKAVAVALRLIPRDMTSPWKRVLRRLAFGPLVPLPAELPSDCPTGDEVAPIATTSRDATHQALLALGRAARP